MRSGDTGAGNPGSAADVAAGLGGHAIRLCPFLLRSFGLDRAEGPDTALAVADLPSSHLGIELLRQMRVWISFSRRRLSAPPVPGRAASATPGW